MGNPLRDIIQRQGGGQRQASSNPLRDIIGGGGAVDTATQEIGPGGPITEGDAMQQAQTRFELSGMEEQSTREWVKRLETILARPDLEPARRARIQKIVDRYKTVDVFGIALTNPRTDVRPGRPRTTMENLGRGLAHGAVSHGLLGASDLVGAIAQFALPKSLENMIGLPKFRENIREAQTILREDVFKPEGTTGLIGTATGALIGGYAPFKVLNSTGLKVLSRIPGIGPYAASVAVKGTLEGATYLQRLSANLVGSGAVDMVQLADVLTTEGMTDQQKAVALLAVAGMSVGTGAIMSLRPNKIGGKLPPAEPEATKPDTDVPPPATGKRAEEADALVKKVQEAEALQEQTLRLNRAARSDWEVKNPDKNFADLPKEERRAILDAYKARVKPQTEFDLTPKPPPEEPPPAAGARPTTPELPTKPITGEPTTRAPEPTPTPPAAKPDVTERTNQLVDEEVNRLQKQLTEAIEQRDVARRQAETDQLTGMGNKDAWLRARATVDADPESEIVFFDLTNFKAWNDRYGNAEGDGLIKDYAASIQTAVASVDAPVRVFRQGDEFFAVVPKGQGETVAQRAKEIGGKTAVDKFEIGLRSAIGNTFAEADAAMSKLKAGESGVRYRPKPSEGTTFHGVKLKKPLDQMNANEIERLTTTFDDLVEQGKISDVEYSQVLRELSDADAALNKRMINEIISEMAVTGEGTVGAKLDPSLLRKLGANLYQGSLDKVVVREGIQNAVDAIRPMLQEPNAGILTDGPKIKIAVNEVERTIEFVDSGVGMTPEVAQNQFMDPGGSFKHEGSTGGYGLAKVGLLANAEFFELRTVADTPEGRMETFIYGSAEDWANGTLKSAVGPTDSPTGTALSIKFTPDVDLSEYNTRTVFSEIKWWSDPEIANALTYKSKTSKGWDHVDAIVSMRPGMEHVSEQELPNAKINIWHSQEVTSPDTWDVFTRVHFLNNGLFQYTDNMKMASGGPKHIVADIKHTVDVTHPKYPYTTSREQVKSGVPELIRKHISGMATALSKKFAEQLKDALLRAPTAPGGWRVVDPSGSTTSPAAVEIAKSPKMNRWLTQVDQAYRTLALVLDEQRHHLAMGENVPLTTAKFHGIWLGQNVLGVNVSGKGLGDVLREAGEVTSNKPANFIMVNPFSLYAEVNLALKPGEKIHQVLAGKTFGTIIHELAHEGARNHDETFAGVLTRMLDVITETNEIGRLRGAWEDLLDGREFNELLSGVRGLWDENRKNIFKGISVGQETSVGGRPSSELETGNLLQPRPDDLGGGRPTGGGPEGTVRTDISGGERPNQGPDAARADVEGRFAELEAKAEEIRRNKGVTLYTHPAVTGFAAGIAAGMVMPADDAQERWRNMLYFGAAGALGTAAFMRRMKKSMDASVPGYQKNIRKHVHSIEDGKLENRQGIYSRLLKAYGHVARRDVGITAVDKITGAAGFRAGHSAGKRAELFGLWRNLSDNAIFGDKWGWWTNDGEFIDSGALTMKQIADLAKGDVRTVGDLAAAYRELVLRSGPQPRTTGLELEDARRMYANAPEHYHQAARELSKSGKALKEMLVQFGLISRETSDKMDLDQWFWVPIRRLFGVTKESAGEPGKTSETIDVKRTRDRRRIIGPEQLAKRLRGSKLPYQNPYEAMIDMMPRYFRATELNRLAQLFFDSIQQLDPKERRLIARPIERANIPKVEGEDAKVNELRNMMFAEANVRLSKDEARAMVIALSDESLNLTNDVIRFYRNGQVEAWRVSDPVARAFRSLQPHEFSAWMEAAGFLTKPANWARVGITANPVFIGAQAIRDIWQFHQNGIYAPPPEASILAKTIQSPASLAKSAYFSMRAWLEQMFRTDAYKEYVRVGGGGESIASQGLRIVRGNIKESMDILDKLKESPTKTQWEQIAKEVKAVHWREAYASMMQPVADAGRFGAWLHERGRGVDAIEALYRTRKAGANFWNRGDALTMAALNRATLFLNPAIQGMDASRYAFRRDPYGYIIRGIVGVSLPSLYLWARYHDDEEIQQLRRTPNGSRFWWFRDGDGKIRKIHRPIFEGQLFGSTVEAWLDMKKDGDPLAVRNWVEGMYNDMSVNLLPLVGVVPVSLMTGKVWGLGTEIAPPGVQGLDPEYRAQANTSTLARIIAEKAGGLSKRLGTELTDNLLSPAGIEFVVQTHLGTMGSEGLRLLSVAVDVMSGSEMPPVEEMPFIRSIYGQYPSMSTAAIKEFYHFAERYEKSANTVLHIANSDPEKLADYMIRYQDEIDMADMYSKARQRIADLRRAIEDFRQMPKDMITDTDRREMIHMYMRDIIDEARATNEMNRLYVRAYKDIQ